MSLNQLNTFVAVAELGSFSAAARALEKAQSAVSHSISQLEKELGLELFDRSGRTPQLTDAGGSLLVEARQVLQQVSQLQNLASQWSETEEEQSFSLVVDMLFPVEPLVQLIGGLRERFPRLNLAVHSEARGAVTARVMDESGQLGVTGLLLPNVPIGIEVLPLGSIDLVAVVSPKHPLAQLEQPVSLNDLRQHTQLVLDDRSQLSSDHEIGVVGANNWKIGSQFAKHRFLLEGFGWGVMARHEVRETLENGLLKAFQPVIWNSPTMPLPLHIIHRSDRLPGTVAKRAIRLLKELFRTRNEQKS